MNISVYPPSAEGGFFCKIYLKTKTETLKFKLDL